MITREQLPWMSQVALDEANEIFEARARGNSERRAAMEAAYIERCREHHEGRVLGPEDVE